MYHFLRPKYFLKWLPSDCKLNEAMDEIQVKYLIDIFSISTLLEVIPKHNEIYNNFKDIPIIVHAPVNEEANKMLMVKSTISPEELDTK